MQSALALTRGPSARPFARHFVAVRVTNWISVIIKINFKRLPCFDYDVVVVVVVVSRELLWPSAFGGNWKVMPLLSLLGLPFRAIIVSRSDSGKVRGLGGWWQDPVRRGTAIKLFMAVWQLPSSESVSQSLCPLVRLSAWVHAANHDIKSRVRAMTRGGGGGDGRWVRWWSVETFLLGTSHMQPLTRKSWITLREKFNTKKKRILRRVSGSRG